MVFTGGNNNNNNNNPIPVYDVPTVFAVVPPNNNPIPVYDVPTVFAVVPPNPPSISVIDHHLPYDTHNRYDVIFHSHSINTLLTTSPSFVDTWISDTLRRYAHITNLIVGLDVEWRPNFSTRSNNPVATLQLCVGHRCLVFQILHAPYVPNSLAAFLRNSNHTFVGVGIKDDVEKLLEDYSLDVGNFVDLRELAADTYCERQLKNAGLKTLSLRVLGLEAEKPNRVRMSKWDNLWLTAEQVQYACVDAFISFEVGMHLMGYYGR